MNISIYLATPQGLIKITFHEPALSFHTQSTRSLEKLHDVEFYFVSLNVSAARIIELVTCETEL